MLSKIRALKEKKGFTLVELIVVLVILAILAALLIPALTGYIDKANKEKVVAEARMVVMAVQTEASTVYGSAGEVTSFTSDQQTEIAKLAEVKGTWNATVDKSGVVTSVTYNHNGWQVVYNSTSSGVGYADPTPTSDSLTTSYTFTSTSK